MNASGTARGYKGLPMEGPIATWYARTTFKDLGRHKLMAAQMAETIPAGGRVLEIAPGPGYFCLELAKLGQYQITGLDISKTFVEIACKNAAEANVKVDFRQGNASDMPFADNAFDFTFCQAAFKNFSQPAKAIAEMYRVLRPGGVSVIVDLRHDASMGDIDDEIKHMRLGRVDGLFTRWTFRLMLLRSAYSIADMEALVAQTPFGKGKIDASGIGFQLSLEKPRA